MNRYLLFAACFVSLGLLGCDSNSDTLTINQITEGVDFGDPYVIAGGDHPPHIDAGALLITVQYSGGCADHKFDVRSRVQSDTTQIWLQHDGNGDACEAYLTDPLDLTLPQSVLTANHIILLGSDDTTFLLR